LDALQSRRKTTWRCAVDVVDAAVAAAVGVARQLLACLMVKKGWRDATLVDVNSSDFIAG